MFYLLSVLVYFMCFIPTFLCVLMWFSVLYVYMRLVSEINLTMMLIWGVNKFVVCHICCLNTWPSCAQQPRFDFQNILDSFNLTRIGSIINFIPRQKNECDLKCLMLSSLICDCLQ